MGHVTTKNRWDQLSNRYSGPWGPNPWINAPSVAPPRREANADSRQQRTAASEGEDGSSAGPPRKV